MKNVYPVLFTKTDTVVLIEVPDFEILTQGNDLQDAIVMARDAIQLKCVSMEDNKEKIPNPSKLNSIKMENAVFLESGETFVSLVDVDSTEYRRKIDTKTVRRNVALPSWLNYEAEHAGINVSRVLQEALMEVLNVNKVTRI